MSLVGIKKIAVAGAGAMGRGIAQLFAQSGHEVLIYDADPAATAAALEFIKLMFERGVEKGRLTRARADEYSVSVNACPDLTQLANCDLVVEAIVEDVDIKRELFAQLEDIVGPGCILASNTSSLTIAEIAAHCRQPERVAGLHFFNPVPLMKLVEVISAVRTSETTVASLVELVNGTGHHAVVAADQPGFLVNHAGRGLYTEGLRILEEQVASAEDVDTVMREAAGFRMGPFELLDLTGLDVSARVMESIYQQFQQEPRFRPSSLVAPRVAAGLFGRKTGAGWYPYHNGEKQLTSKSPIPVLQPGLRLWVDPEAEQYNELRQLGSSAGLAEVAQPAEADLVLIQPWGDDASYFCAQRALPADKTVAIDPLPGLHKHRTLMLTVATTPNSRDAAHALMASDGIGVTLINDSPGFITQRVLATIVNIAAELAQRGIAGVTDIENAVRLALGYPGGPLGIGDAIGPARVELILQRMQALLGDPRYRPSRWISRRVGLALPLVHVEAPR
jgi:3-hydroxybutyryl-CoA dehydrogenase